jgi:hypothetical protein
MQSSKSKQRGGNCGAGMCSLQMGGRRTKSRTVRRTKQRGRGCGCQGANAVRGPQMGGRRTKSRTHKRKRGGAIASGSEVSLRNK